MAPSPTLKWLLQISLAEIATMLTFASYTAAQPLLQRAWQMGAAQAGAIFAAQQAGYTLAVLLLSSLTDLIGVRRIYLLSAAWNAAAGGAFALFAHGFAGALPLRALIGVGLAGTYMPGMRLVAETFPTARRGGALGVYIACFSVGAALSLFVSGSLMAYGARTMLLITALGPLAAVPLAWRAAHDIPQSAHWPRRIPFRSVLGNIAAMRFILGYAAHNWELFGMRAWLPIFLTTAWTARSLPLGQAARLGATTGSAILLAGALSNALGGLMSDRLGRARTIVAVLGASAACSLTIGWLLPTGVLVVTTVGVAYGLLVTAESSTLSTAVAEQARPGELGTTMAVQSSIGFVATIISPALFGVLLDAYGWGWAFASLGGAAVAGVLLVLLIGRRL